MDELEEIRKKKLEELKQQQLSAAQQQMGEQAQVQQQIEMLEAIVKKKLTKEAIERYSNVKLAHPEKAMQLLMLISQSINSIDGMVSDEELKKILMLMEGKKRDIKITMK